jgi:hypothetical protein
MCFPYFVGTFYIDPKIPSLGFEAKGHRARKKNPPHASFRTRGGAISLDLGTTGDVEDVSKAFVLVSSRTGNIIINLVCSLYCLSKYDIYRSSSYSHHPPDLA